MDQMQGYIAALDFFKKVSSNTTDYTNEIAEVLEVSQKKLLSDIYEILGLEIMKQAYPSAVYTDLMPTKLLQDIQEEFLTMQTDLQKLGKDLYPLQQQKLEIVQDLLAKRTGNQ